MELRKLEETYLEIAKTLSSALEQASRRPTRLRALLDYTCELHDLHRAGMRHPPEEYRDAFQSLIDEISRSVDGLLEPVADTLVEAIRREREFVPGEMRVASKDDTGFWNWVNDRIEQCRKDFREADGVMERVGVVRECVKDIHERSWEEMKGGLGSYESDSATDDQQAGSEDERGNGSADEEQEG